MSAIYAADTTPDAPTRSHVCLECGAPFLAHATLARHAEFCCTTCRKTWNNRRAVRGATVYDLFMCLRYERKLAGKLRIWAKLCRLCMEFRSEDHAEREGRKSWRRARDVLAERPYLSTLTIADQTWRRAG